jgi:hypothetical protein
MAPRMVLYTSSTPFLLLAAVLWVASPLVSGKWTAVLELEYAKGGSDFDATLTSKHLSMIFGRSLPGRYYDYKEVATELTTLASCYGVY